MTGLSELETDQAHGGPATSFQRPPPDTDQLYMLSGNTEVWVDHPSVAPDSRRDQRSGKPLVHFGVVATGSMKDRTPRQQYLDDSNVRAFDAGFQAVMESIEGNRKDSVVLVRGVCDYGDGTSADTKARRGEKDWRPHSALAAACVMKSIVLALVARSEDDDD